MEKFTYSEQMFIESEVEKRRKSKLFACVLLFFLGIFGAHRFYLGKNKTGLIQLVFTILNCILMMINFFFFPFFFLAIVPILFVTLAIAGLSLVMVIWLSIDLFLVSKYVNEDKERIRRETAKEVMNYR